MTEPERQVTISFMGGALVPGLPKSVTLALAEPVTVAELFRRLEAAIGMPELRAKATKYFVILVDGTSIQHLQGWETPVAPGATVSVAAPMGGG